MKRVLFPTLAIGLLVSPVVLGAVSDEDIDELREQLAVMSQRLSQTFRPTLPRRLRHLQQPKTGRNGPASMVIFATVTRGSTPKAVIRAGETGFVRE